jgi:hypothetical protein
MARPKNYRRLLEKETLTSYEVGRAVLASMTFEYRRPQEIDNSLMSDSSC